MVEVFVWNDVDMLLILNLVVGDTWPGLFVKGHFQGSIWIFVFYLG